MESEPKLDPSTITDVETAKLALRWAVEKIHTMQEELGRLREDNHSKTNLSRSLTEQLDQKTEVLKKWQGTIKTWEENWRTQTAMETDLKSKLREQILNEETSNWRQARAQLEKMVLALKEELAAREGEIGRLKLDLIDTRNKSSELKEEELNTILKKQQDHLAERETAMAEKYARFEREMIETQRIAAEQQELSLKERYEIKMREFSKLYEQKEAQLEKFRKEIEDRHLATLENLEDQNRARVDQLRMELDASRTKKAEEAGKIYEERLKSLEAAFSQKQTELEKTFRDREIELEESHSKELDAMRAAREQETAALRGRMRDFVDKREQEYVTLRLEMERQVTELVKSRETEIKAGYQKAVEETRRQWNLLALGNQKKLEDLLNSNNAEWESRWENREAELSAAKAEEIKIAAERAALEVKTREAALRENLLREQNEWIASQNSALEEAKKALEKSHAERSENAQKNLEAAYLEKEKTMFGRIAAAQKRMRAKWQAREEGWLLEKEADAQAEREKLKKEFHCYRLVLKEKLGNFEDEMKLNYAAKEEELETSAREKLKTKEAELSAVAAKKEQAAKLRAELEMRRIETDAAKSLNTIKDEHALALETLKKKFELEQAEKTAAFEEEKQKLREAGITAEAAWAAKAADRELELENKLKEERLKLGEGNKTRELHLENREKEIEQFKTTLQQKHDELKIKLYQELQVKEHELFLKLSAAKEEMYEAVNSHRSVIDMEYDERINQLRAKEAELETRFEEKNRQSLETMKKQKQDELDRLELELERHAAELENRFKNREKSLNAAFSERLAKMETDFIDREKEFTVTQEKALAKRRQELEAAAKQKEKELEKKYSDLTRDLHTESRQERDAWEAQKMEVLNRERQMLRAEFEKKEAILNQKFDEELSGQRRQRVIMEEELAAKKEALEKTYYAELARSRETLDKLRLELGEKITVKHRELEAEKNRMTMLISQKEEQYAAQYRKKEEELLKKHRE